MVRLREQQRVELSLPQVEGLMREQDHIRHVYVLTSPHEQLATQAGWLQSPMRMTVRNDKKPDDLERANALKATHIIPLYVAMVNTDLLSADECAQAESLLGRKKIENVKRLSAAEAARFKAGEPSIVAEAETKEENAAAREPVVAAQEAIEIFADGRFHPLVADRTSNTPFLINLVNSVGHIDSSEVTAALRVTDGALVVIDGIAGACVQTQTVLLQVIAERVRPILFVQGLDHLFLELQMDLEQCYQTFARSIESINVVISTYKDESLGDVRVSPERGTVAFGSGVHGWGFTIQRFAAMYASKFGVTRAKMMKRLWGDNFLSNDTKKWTSSSTAKAGQKGDRGFCVFILTPIETLFRSIMDGKKDVYEAVLPKLGITIPKENREDVGKPLLKVCMQEWLPASQAYLQMICNHLPSPAVAQRYRVENLYSGPLDDPVANGIRACDPNAPLCMYVSKMVPTSEKGRFYGFGRVFSGIIATGQTVRIQGPDYQVGKKTDLYVKNSQLPILMMGRDVEYLHDCPCGNLIGLAGVGAYLLKSGTITTYEQAHNIVTMKYSISPVVRVSVDVTNAIDLPRLMDGLKNLSRSSTSIQCWTASTGEHLIGAPDEAYLNSSIHDLRDDYLKDVTLRISPPMVSFAEGISAASSQPCLAKSPNKHSRFTMTAQPLSEEFARAVDQYAFNTEDEAKTRAHQLIARWPNDWNLTDAHAIWCFGPPSDGHSNVLVDQTKKGSVTQYDLGQISELVTGAFRLACSSGCLAEEPLRASRFNIVDITLQSLESSVWRNIRSQVMGPTKRAMFACQLVSQPILLEPIYVCDITVLTSAVPGVYASLNARRGQIETQVEHPTTPLTQVKAYLPVSESFGFTSFLRQQTGGEAFPHFTLSHWSPLEGSPLEAGTPAYNQVMALRYRKGIKQELPQLSDYHDKI